MFFFFFDFTSSPQTSRWTLKIVDNPSCCLSWHHSLPMQAGRQPRPWNTCRVGFTVKIPPSGRVSASRARLRSQAWSKAWPQSGGIPVSLRDHLVQDVPEERDSTLQWFVVSLLTTLESSCLTLWDPMNCSTPGFALLQCLPEFAQTHVHWVSDVIQLSYPLLSTSPCAFSLSQHHGLSKWVRSSHHLAKVLEFQLQHQSFQWTLRTDLL